MAKERRDSKNRLLEKGEYQKEDGRYMYRYTDASGNARFVYSWTLTKTDRTPKGKTPGPCLRDLKREILRDSFDGIDTYKGKTSTVNDYFEKYISQKKNIKNSTRCRYVSLYNLYLRNRIGSRKISTIKFSDVKKCYNDIAEECGISVSTLRNVNGLLIPLLKLAVRDGLIRNNPADGAFSDISRETRRTTSKREALTIEQQKAFIDFVSGSKTYAKWKNFFTVMLGTGCRVGEMCGLTWDDCDFSKNLITIRRTIYYYKDDALGCYKLSVQTPKSASGFRSIPMFKDVRNALLQEKTRQLREGFCTEEIDGVTGFIFGNRNGKARIPENVNDSIHNIIAKYNHLEEEAASKEGRSAVAIPDFTSHVLRHTFCTRMCESKIDIKVLQEIMGHSTISMTLDVYTSVSDEYKAAAFDEVEAKMKIV